MKFTGLLIILQLLLCVAIAPATTRLQLEQGRLDSLQYSIQELADSLDQLGRVEQDQLKQLDRLQRRLDLSRRLLDEATAQVTFLETDLQRITSSLEQLQEREVVLKLRHDAAVQRRDTLQYHFRHVIRKLYMAMPLPLGRYLLTAEDSESLLRRHAFLSSINQSVADRKTQLLREIRYTDALRDSLAQLSTDQLALQQIHQRNLKYQRELLSGQEQRISELQSNRLEYRQALDQ
ncbi:MAG: hypothetical protein K8R46_10035, partial [Pirellulales bacterium]|nr:hypothetical protein [Pirellulales bacterium]